MLSQGGRRTLAEELFPPVNTLLFGTWKLANGQDAGMKAYAQGLVADSPGNFFCAF